MILDLIENDEAEQTAIRPLLPSLSGLMAESGHVFTKQWRCGLMSSKKATKSERRTRMS